MKISTLVNQTIDYEFDPLRDKDDFVFLDNNNLPTIKTPPYILPSISLTPINSEIPKTLKNKTNHYYKLSTYFGKKFSIYPRAASCIAHLIKHLNIKKTDNVAIYKTFENNFISRCITDTILLQCEFTRAIDKNTKAVMVIHEFGYPYKEVPKLKNMCKAQNIPLIENCAWTFDHNLSSKTRLGGFGDYVIYSLPKIIPVLYGGVIVGLGKNKSIRAIKTEKEKLIKDQLVRYMPNIKKYNNYRRKNWGYLNKLFLKDKHASWIKLENNVYPAVYLVRNKSYQRLYDKYLKYGVEVGRYYHKESLYLPIHQNLNKNHLDYIFAIYNGQK